MCASYIFLSALPVRCLCYTHQCMSQLLGCGILHTCCCHPFVFVVQSHCFSITSLHHSLMSVLFCSALLCPPSSSSSSSASCLGCLYVGAFVFSAVPVPPPPGVNIEEHIQIRQEEKRQRINRRHRLEEGRGMDQG